jgi:hypothetical protein
MSPPANFLALAAVTVCALAPSASSALAAEPIEGVWSFNGGEVAVQAGSNGTLTGTVVEPTRFSNCTHPVGEQVWTEMRRRPDGSYWGLHQWYFDTSECLPNPTLGSTAWRVLQDSNGAKYLRVCFSEPGSTSQPTIAADGTTAGATFGCSDSALISSLPPALSAAEAARYIVLPPNGSCFSRRRLRVKLTSPVSDPFATAAVTLKSAAIRRRAKLSWTSGAVLATLRLRGLEAPTFKVTVQAETVLGHRLDAKRTYRRCVDPRQGGHRLDLGS